MQVCTSLQTDNHASTPPLSFLQAGCPSCRPTNSVQALKARRTHSSKTCNSQYLQLTMDQYADSPAHSAYFYAEVAVSSPVVATTIANTHLCLPTEGWSGILYQLPPFLLAIFWILLCRER